MASIARRNLFSDKIRLAITLVGITFAVVLMVGQVGAYLGFMNSASQLIDYSNADIWITAKNTINFDSAKPFPERKMNKVKEVRGVLWVDKIAQTWGLMKLKNGGTESVQIIGINLDKDVGIPWKIKAGSIKDLKIGTSIMVDESSLDRLGSLRVGDEVEIFKERAKVVGITKEVKSFTTYPVIFTYYKTAREFSLILKDNQTTFGLVKVAPEFSVGSVVEELKKISAIDVYTKNDFSWKTRKYWTIQTGMGIAIGVTVLLGFIVGTAIVGQTIYASTIEHLREFGTLKAIGATNFDIYKIIFEQALINACLGYALGLAMSFVTKRSFEGIGAVILMPGRLIVIMFFVTVIMCLLSSFISIRKAAKVDPVIVFKA